MRSDSVIEEKPRHWQPDYAAQFGDESIVSAYPARPPYPQQVFDRLASFVLDSYRHVLELGAGTGDLTFGLAARVDLLDAVEPAAAMLVAAKKLTSKHANKIRWIQETAEGFQPRQLYSLIVAAESLHWMDWSSVLPKLGGCLLPSGRLAIVTDRVLIDLPWLSELRALVPQFSTNQDYRAHDVVHEVVSRGLFREVGREVIVSEPFCQTLDQYVESFHSRNGFSRERMSPEAAASFDAEVRKLVSVYRSDGLVEGPVRATVVWGVPKGHVAW